MWELFSFVFLIRNIQLRKEIPEDKNILDQIIRSWNLLRNSS